MQKQYYHNRNGNMHSEESQEHYHEEKKEQEHEYKKLLEVIDKLDNEDYEHYETEEYNNMYHITFKKQGEDSYKKFKIKYGVNYDKLKDEL
jgi:hypothetical protein